MGSLFQNTMQVNTWASLVSWANGRSPFDTVTAEPINGGHDEESLPFGDFTYDGLAFKNCNLGRDALVDGVDVFYRESPIPPGDRVMMHVHGFGLSGREGQFPDQPYEPAPADIAEPGSEVPVAGSTYHVFGRSAVVLVSQPGGTVKP